MLEYIVLLATITPIALHTPTGVQDTPQDIAREFLPLLCPMIDTWNGNQTSKGDSILEEESCCTACSFDLSCGVNHKCCFPKMSQASLDTAVYPRECVYPMETQMLASQRRYYSSYWMVNDVKSNANNRTATKCGDVKIAPWGSLAPVHSKTTGKIYTNIACATEDNVTDGVLWDMLLICKNTIDMLQTRDVSSFISQLYISSSPKNCRFRFKYPGDILDIKSEICFTNLINTCKNEEFTIPNDVNLTTSQIRQTCTSGLVSPYRVRDMYQNVFCHICNGKIYSGKAKCSIDIDEKGGFNGNFISILADSTLLSEFYTRHEMEKRKVPLACQTHYRGDKMQETCRPVICPSGKYRDRNGNCVLVIKKWYMEKFDLYIKLTADTVFDVDEIFKNDEMSLSHKWPSVWIIKAVFKRTLYKRMDRSLYITLHNTLPSTDAAKLLKNIRILLKRPWILTLSNETAISMSAEIGFVTQSFVKSKESSKYLNQKLNDSLQNDIPHFVNIYHNSQRLIDKSTFIVTKLYFCEQIELKPSEYELIEGSILYNKNTKQLLLYGQFAIALSSQANLSFGEKGQELARICLKDSRFIKEITNGVAGSSESALYAVNITLIVFINSFLF